MAASIALYGTSAGLTFPNAGAATQINFGTLISDADSLVSNASSNWTFTAPSTGLYILQMFLYFSNSAAHTNLFELEARVNGSFRTTFVGMAFSDNTYTGIQGAACLSLSSGDTVTVYGNNYATASFATYNNSAYNQIWIYKVN